MTSARLVDAFGKAALSPDPDLAVAALLIARVEYPELDAGRYLAQLDFIGGEACRRLSAAAPPADTPPDVDPDRYARVVALNATCSTSSASRGTRPTTAIRATARTR